MKDKLLAVVYIVLSLIMVIIPTGFEKNIYYNAENAKAEVLEVNNNSIYQTGLMRQGEQILKVKILSGSHKGEKLDATNFIQGKLESDKVYKKGETIYVLIENKDDKSVGFVNTVDHYRIPAIIVLVLLFAALLVIFSGFTGLKTIMSFIFAILAIIKLLVPMTLKGYSPLLVGLFVGNLISVVCILLISGFNRRSYSAMIAAAMSSLMTLFTAVIFSKWLHLDGTELPWVESLLYAGFQDLKLNEIMQSAIYLSCSGAILDLAIDISAGLEEVVKHKSDIKKEELLKSAYEIGKTVVGSQTTTLLLAYIGSYLTIMMVYMAQGTPVLNIITSKSIAQEILHTFVGCMGLIFVSPLSAITFTFLYRKKSSLK